MKITISVTQDDIDNGEMAECTGCPIALALNRVMPTAGWRVFEVQVFAGDGQEFEARLPRSAQDFIYAFDFGEPAKPFEFVLDVPDVLAPAGAS